MTNKINSLLFLESDMEINLLEDIIKNKEIDLTNTLFVSSSPNIRCRLEDLGFSVNSSLDYTSLVDHQDGAMFVASCINELNSRIIESCFQDQYGVSESYRISVQYRMQYFIAHLTQLVQMYLNIIEKEPSIKEVLFFKNISQTETSALLNINESYHENIIKLITDNKSLSRRPLVILKERRPREQYKITFFNTLLLRSLNYILRSFDYNNRGRNIIITSVVNKMDVIVSDIQLSNPHSQFVLLHGMDSILSPFKLNFKNMTKKIFLNLGLLTLNLLNKKIKLKSKNISVNGIIDFESELLCQYYLSSTKYRDKNLAEIEHLFLKLLPKGFIYKGIPLFSLIIEKLHQGVIPLLQKSLVATEVLENIVDEIDVLGVLSPHSLDASSSLGEISRIKKLKSILVSHGSHPIPYNKEAIEEYKRHGEALIDTQYPYVSIQSELMNQYCDYFKIASTRVVTGPLCWGILDKHDPEVLQKIGLPKGKKVIVHAGSQKGRSSHYFYRYETADEYIQALKDLIEVVNQLDDTVLLIKFRDGENLSYKNLQKILPKSKNVFYNNNASFLQIIKEADLLVSFSSTTIEESFEFRKPVLLYGGYGRLKFVESLEVGYSFKRFPAYHVTNKDNLKILIIEILKELDKKKLETLELANYVISKERRSKLGSFFYKN